MDKTITGGAAFPDPGRAQSAKQRETLTETGMTLRDYFAAKAMAGFLASGRCPLDPPYGNFARPSYAMADAMLVARGRSLTAEADAAMGALLIEALRDCVAVMERELNGLAVIQPELRAARVALAAAGAA